ncbi:asparaginase [Rhizosaccharibacter radicis]|uniref:Asparaginase n=1 Tax=Rhizosaccharibacter radicis TaxID=2782605 RepID=A0ABT1VZ58_9PROT|nr:asparaginase [Acetobacteraceae bacterium KSS12]
MDALLVEVTRGDRVESRHAGAAVVADTGGMVLFRAGDVDAPIYARSTVKAMLAVPLVESGAADRLGLTPPELALACASHSGLPIHADTAAAMLARAGRDEGCLECGAHWPTSPSAAQALAGAGRQPSALHNSCSGKHAGFVCLACDAGHPVGGYVEPEHPVMRQVTQAMSDLTDCRLDEENRGIDGCGIPTYALPLRALATGFARFGCGTGLSADRAEAVRRLREAVAAHPEMVAGEGCFDTRMIEAFGPALFSKMGAEGVQVAALPELGLGIAVKSADGSARAAEVAMAALLARYLPADDERHPVLDRAMRPVLRNWLGREIGGLRPAGALLPRRTGDAARV